MPIIEDTSRSFYPNDWNGKITIQDLIDTINAGSGVSSGGTTQSKSGFFNYNNSIPKQTIQADAWTTIQNNGAGTFTELRFAPPGVESMLDPATGKYSLAGLEPGDEIYVRHTLSILPYMNGMDLKFRNYVGQPGSQYSVSFGPATQFNSGAGVDSGIFVVGSQFFVRDGNSKLGGFLPQIMTTATADLQYIGCYISITRR